MHTRARCRPGQARRPAPIPGRPQQIGFVWHSRLPAPAGPSELASFCAIGLRGPAAAGLAAIRNREIGFVSHGSSPPRHSGGHGAEAELSPVMNSEFSLRSRCPFGVGATHASPVRLRLGGGQRSTLYRLRPTHGVPDPGKRRGHLRRRPRSYNYRRFSTPVCCAQIKNWAEIPRCPTSPARRAKDHSPAIHGWGQGQETEHCRIPAKKSIHANVPDIFNAR